MDINEVVSLSDIAAKEDALKWQAAGNIVAAYPPEDRRDVATVLSGYTDTKRLADAETLADFHKSRS